MATNNKAKRRFTPPEAPVVQEPETSPDVKAGEEWEEVLTVNGKPIPPEFAHAIPYAQTDQGIAEKEAKRTHPPSGVSLGRDATDKAHDRMLDFDEYDPLKELKDQHAEAGFAYRMLGPRSISKRGKRGWEPVVGANGDQAKHGDLILAKIPIAEKQRRNDRLLASTREQMEQFNEQFSEDQAKLIRDSGVKGVAPLRTGDHVASSYSDAETMIGRQHSRGSDLAA